MCGTIDRYDTVRYNYDALKKDLVEVSLVSVVRKEAKRCSSFVATGAEQV